MFMDELEFGSDLVLEDEEPRITTCIYCLHTYTTFWKFASWTNIIADVCLECAGVEQGEADDSDREWMSKPWYASGHDVDCECDLCVHGYYGACPAGEY